MASDGCCCFFSPFYFSREKVAGLPLGVILHEKFLFIEHQENYQHRERFVLLDVHRN